MPAWNPYPHAGFAAALMRGGLDLPRAIERIMAVLLRVPTVGTGIKAGESDL